MRRNIFKLVMIAFTGIAPAAAVICLNSCATEKPPVSGTDDAGTETRGIHTVPEMQGGKIRGYKVIGMKGNKTWCRIDIREGDIIVRINGIRTNSIESLFDAYNSLLGKDRFSVEVIRDGRMIVLTSDSADAPAEQSDNH